MPTPKKIINVPETPLIQEKKKSSSQKKRVIMKKKVEGAPSASTKKRASVKTSAPKKTQQSTIKTAVQTSTVHTKKTSLKTPVHQGEKSTPRFGSMMSMIGLQFIIAGCAVVVLMLMGLIEQNVFTTKQGRAEAIIEPATIGMEFSGRTSLGVVVGKKDDAGYISLTNRSQVPIALSLPSSWNRVEVVGASLEATKGELPVFGFTRYTFPAKSTIKFSVQSLPSDLLFDAPGNGVAIVEVNIVDVENLTRSTETILVQKQRLLPLRISEE